MPYVPLTWLAEHVAVPAGTTAEDLAADLVRVGLEEESIVPAAVTGPLVVGRVLTVDVETHKNGKAIRYCRVDVGPHNDAPGTGAEPSELPSRGIVCGAHNFAVGDSVVVSLPGAVLPGPFAIAARKTYGHVSDGMICSDRELGLGDDHDGIIVLDERLAAVPAPGTDAIALLGLGEEVLEINVTPDRGYCFAMRGVAREYSHSTGAAFTDPGLAANLPGGEPPAATPDGFGVTVADDAPIAGNVGCDRFVTRIVRGIDPAAPSPDWLRQRLTAAGMRPISLAVDVTNYVMLDLGQPLHAYDLALLAAPIVVRRARAGERIVTLDDVERALDPQDLLITDSPEGPGSRIQGLAGVMGGALAEVGAGTTDVLIEAAHFDPVSIARTARRHKLPSEAAKRFERGVDTRLQHVAAQRVVDLLVEHGGGTADPAVTDLDTTVAPEPLSFRLAEVERLTGVRHPREVVVEVLERIGCDVRDESEDTVAVTPPTWRPDLVGPAYLVEEVARLTGYEQIPSTLPTAPAGRGLTRGQKVRRDVARALADHGLTEVLSYPFIGDAHDRLHLPADDARRLTLRLANPMAEDAPALRTSLLDTLLDVARRNVSRGVTDVALFELGLVTHPAGVGVAAAPGAADRPTEDELATLAAAVPHQPRHVAGVIVGRAETGILGSGRSVDWADAVAAAQVVAAAAGVRVTVASADLAPWHPGRCARLAVGDATVGYAGELHPRVLADLDLPARSVAFELDLDVLIAAVPQDALQVTPVSTFPVAKEDLALVVDAALPAGDLVAAVRAGAGGSPAGDVLEAVTVFDVYTGTQVGEGRKSVALALRLRAPDRTLTAEEIVAVREHAVAEANRRHGAVLRS